MNMPLVPPFAVTAAYQTSQFATGTYTQGGSQVFSHLKSPPSAGVAAETAADEDAENVGFESYGNRSEVQVVTIVGSPNNGTFQLAWGGALSVPIAYNASAATVQAALVGLASVPGSTGGTNEVQTVTITGTPEGGTFTLTYSGQTTASIAYNAPATGANSVQTRLTALSNVGTGNVVVTGSAGGPYAVTFQGDLANTNVAQMTATASLTGGSTPGVTVATQTGGVAKTPNVTVTGSNGGPYTVTFGNLLANKDVALISGVGRGLQGGTNPRVTVVATAQGRRAFVNDAVLDATRQRDGMRNFYDTASGNHF